MRDEDAVARFVERFATSLVDAGIPRMPARIFALLQATDSGRRTAAEIAGLLQASPAAISGAVRYLIQVGLVSREREPGSRRDVYQVHDDQWYDAIGNRDALLIRWEANARDGVAVLGADTPAGARLAETMEFFAFLQVEMPAMLDRWHARRAESRRAR